MRKTWLFGSLALLISSIIFIVIAEVLLRVFIFSDSKVANSIKDPLLFGEVIHHPEGDFYLEDYWKFLHIFKGGMNVKNPDSVLGWTENQSLEERIKFENRSLKGRVPVLFYGDSFAQCVDTTKCFQDYLEEDTTFSNHYYFINFGVGGYGVDQIFLMMKRTAQFFKDPIIIMSILSTDMDRSMLGFRDSQKPYFVLDDKNNLTLKGVPINLSTEEYLEANRPKGFVYLGRLLRNSELNKWRDDTERANKYIEETWDLNKTILDSAINFGNVNSRRFYFLLFSPAHYGLNNWRYRKVRNYLEENKISYFADIDIRFNDTLSNYEMHDYIIENDGHPNSYFNGLISREMKNVIMKDSTIYLGPNDEKFFSEKIMIPDKIYGRFLERTKN